MRELTDALNKQVEENRFGINLLINPLSVQMFVFVFPFFLVQNVL